MSPAYQQALDYIYNHVDFSRTHQTTLSSENFTLGNMISLMDMLGNPHRNYPVIHVAGTKGKGSVSAFCASALHSSGYRVGLYTSPHLRDFTERIQIDTKPIEQTALVELLEEIKPHIESLPGLTTFEISTALAFSCFDKNEVDVAVVEVGLGGKLDSTNLVLPIVSVITSISLDHTSILGTTLNAIAEEKAGIIKNGVPVVLSPQEEEVQSTIKRIAHDCNAPLVQVNKTYRIERIQNSLNYQVFRLSRIEGQPIINDFLRDEVGQQTEIRIPLLGKHQVENAATAYTALQVACKRGIPTSSKDLQNGFAAVKWSGRFQILQRDPYFVVDSAHNPYSANILRQTIDDYFPNAPLILVFATLADKNVKGMIMELFPRAREVITSQTVHPRHLKAEELSRIAQSLGYVTKAITPIETALLEAFKSAKKEDAVVLVTGSVATSGAAIEIWESTISDYNYSEASIKELHE